MTHSDDSFPFNFLDNINHNTPDVSFNTFNNNSYDNSFDSNTDFNNFNSNNFINFDQDTLSQQNLYDHSFSFHSSCSQSVTVGIDSYDHINLYDKSGNEHWVGEVHNQQFSNRSHEYVGKLDANLKIYDAHGDYLGYVDSNMNLHGKDDHIISCDFKTALGAAAWMLFAGMGGKE